jgi:hypothetical protein
MAADLSTGLDFNTSVRLIYVDAKSRSVHEIPAAIQHLRAAIREFRDRRLERFGQLWRFCLWTGKARRNATVSEYAGIGKRPAAPFALADRRIS